MSRMNGSVLLLGSVTGDSASEVFHLCGQELKGCLSTLPDGETGYRCYWINFLAATLYDGHPDLQTINRPKSSPDGRPNWAPSGYHDHWRFKIKDGVDNLRFEQLGYANDAIQSYREFRELRDQGIIDAGVRLQVAMPMTESAVRPFLLHAADYPKMCAAYEEAMYREVQKMLRNIPAEDLAIQWDVCMEVFAAECNDEAEGLFLFKPDKPPMVRYAKALYALSKCVPNDVLMGLHICYGDLGHQHFMQPKDLALSVEIANVGNEQVGRLIDFYHMTVPRDRNDDAYFSPLEDLNLAEGKLYLGLVHNTDGVDGSLRRLETAKRHATGFGVSAECGLARRPHEAMPEILRVHKQVATEL